MWNIVLYLWYDFRLILLFVNWIVLSYENISDPLQQMKEETEKMKTVKQVQLESAQTVKVRICKICHGFTTIYVISAYHQ
jgi:hypothetical protein